MIPIMDPEDDYLTIAAAEEQMAMTHESRHKDMHDAHAKVKRESPFFIPRPRKAQNLTYVLSRPTCGYSAFE